MNRRTLAQLGGIFAVLGGLALASLAVQNVAGRLLVTPYPFPSNGQLLVLSILPMLASFVIPLGIVVGLIGLFALLGASSAARWGVGLTAAATLLLAVQPVIPYIFFIGAPPPSAGNEAVGVMIFVSAALSFLTSTLFAAGLVLLYVAARRDQRLGAWRSLLPAIGLLVILSRTAPYALAAVGLMVNAPLFEAFEFVIGALWMALGVAVWRHASESPNLGTSSPIS